MSRIFVVADTRFELSPEVIAKTPLLRDLADLTPDEIPLEGVDLAEFQAFVDYVREGTIPSEEHIQIFNYFQYPISESYGLSWQLENEMRNNFHSGKVYDNYHGLVELTEELWNELSPPRHAKNLLFANRETPEKAKWSVIQYRLAIINKFLHKYPALFLAGGSLISILFGEEVTSVVGKESETVVDVSLLHVVKDLDFFVHGLSEEDANKMLASLLFRMRKVTAKRTKNALTFFEENEPPKQVILHLFASPGAVLGGFDVDCCSIGYDGRNIWLTNRALHAFRVGYNTINLRLLSPSYERRLAKYGTRGFALRVPELDFSTINYDLLNYDLFHKLKESTNIAYNYRFLETGLDSLLFLDAHFRNLGCNEKTRDFFVKLCDYASDYDSGSAHGRVIDFLGDQLTEEDFRACGVNYKEGTIHLRTPLGGYEVYDEQPEYSFLEMGFGKYYLESNKGHSFLLNFPPRLAEALEIELPAELWKKDNPGEQMTSCFHSLVLEDESVWYQGRYSNLTEVAPMKCTFPSELTYEKGPEIQFVVDSDGLYFARTYFIKDYDAYDVCDTADCEAVALIGLDLFRVILPWNGIRIKAQEVESITIRKKVVTFETSSLTIPISFEGYFETADEYILTWDDESRMYRVSEHTRSYIR